MRVILQSALATVLATPRLPGCRRSSSSLVHARQQQDGGVALLGRRQSGAAHASTVGNCIVFNIAGNKYRLVTRILYRSQKVFILKVMSHTEYDNQNWKDECGCFAAPPQPKTIGKAPRRPR